MGVLASIRKSDIAKFMTKTLAEVRRTRQLCRKKELLAWRTEVACIYKWPNQQMHYWWEAYKLLWGCDKLFQFSNIYSQFFPRFLSNLWYFPTFSASQRSICVLRYTSLYMHEYIFDHTICDFDDIKQTWAEWILSDNLITFSNNCL